MSVMQMINRHPRQRREHGNHLIRFSWQDSLTLMGYWGWTMTYYPPNISWLCTRSSAIATFSTLTVYLNNLSTLPCETWNAHRTRYVPLSCQRKKLQKLQEKMYKKRVSRHWPRQTEKVNKVGRVGSCRYCGRHSSVALSPIGVCRLVAL